MGYTGVWYNTLLTESYNGHSMTGQTAPICQPITFSGSWIIGDAGQSCDAVCSHEGTTCNSEELHKLDGQSLDVFKEKLGWFHWRRWSFADSGKLRQNAN